MMKEAYDLIQTQCNHDISVGTIAARNESTIIPTLRRAS